MRALSDALNTRLLSSGAMARRLVALGFAPGARHDDELGEPLPLVTRYFRNQPPQAALPEGKLRALTAPTLLLMGSREVFFRPAQVIAGGPGVPDLRAAGSCRAPGTRYSDRPDVVNTRLLRFLGEPR